jgi:VanZ family protein
MAGIFYLSSIPHLQATSDPTGNFLSRKLGHLIEYAVLFLLIYRATGYRRLVLTFLLTASYGVSDEWHQSFVPSRSPQLEDVGFDTLGAVIGVILWRFFPTQKMKLKT